MVTRGTLVLRMVTHLRKDKRHGTYMNYRKEHRITIGKLKGKIHCVVLVRTCQDFTFSSHFLEYYCSADSMNQSHFMIFIYLFFTSTWLYLSTYIRLYIICEEGKFQTSDVNELLQWWSDTKAESIRGWRSWLYQEMHEKSSKCFKTFLKEELEGVSMFWSGKTTSLSWMFNTVDSSECREPSFINSFFNHMYRNHNSRNYIKNCLL